MRRRFADDRDPRLFDPTIGAVIDVIDEIPFSSVPAEELMHAYAPFPCAQGHGRDWLMREAMKAETPLHFVMLELDGSDLESHFEMTIEDLLVEPDNER